MSWEKLEDEAKKSGTYVKIKDGESVIGVFQGDPVSFYSIFGDKANTRYEEQVEDSTFKFLVNFLVKEKDGWAPKIFQGSLAVLKTILEAKKKYGLDVVMEIKRNGTGKDTRYMFMFDRKLEGDELAAVRATQLLSLKKKEESPF